MFFRNVSYECGSRFQIVWCNRCQVKAIGCMATRMFVCHVCQESNALVRLRVPYIANLTLDELMAAGFAHRYFAEEDKSLDGILDEDAIFAKHQDIAVES